MSEQQKRDGAPPANLLLVDDEPNSLYALQEMLEPLGQIRIPDARGVGCGPASG